MNILEIIKKAPKDHMYYCTILGNVKIEINSFVNQDYPLYTNTERGNFSFTKEGHYFIDDNFGECILFPSRDLRDWKKFELLLDKGEEPKYSFNPFDKVLVRDSPTAKWRCNIYSHYNTREDEEFPYICINDTFKYCIPYEGNEDKVGKV